MGRRVASYYRNQGFMMSRRGREAVANNEFPISHWTERFVMPGNQVEQLLIYMGIHHTGINCEETKFYRLPDPNDTAELMLIYDAFHSVPAKKLNFINIMSKHLQLPVDDKFTKMPQLTKPRKRVKIVRTKKRKRKSRRLRKYRVI